MRRTRFRKRRQLWLPTYGTGGLYSEGVTSGNALGGEFNLFNTGSEPGGIDWLVSPLTFDTQVDPENAQNFGIGTTFPPNLRDLVSGSEWSLRRIVGKLFCVCYDTGPHTTDPGTAPLIDVGAGIIVCNTDENGTPLTDFDEVNPLAQSAAEDPWVWMRHWILSTRPTTMLNDDTSGVLPNSPLVFYEMAGHLPHANWQFGSVQDGPHVDQKTVRRIRRDQRLFLVVATRPNWMFSDGTDHATDSLNVYFRYMFRLLGNIRGSSGNRGNAAR